MSWRKQFDDDEEEQTYAGCEAEEIQRCKIMFMKMLLLQVPNPFLSTLTSVYSLSSP